MRLKLFCVFSEIERKLKPSKLPIIFSDQNYRELSGFYKKSEGGQAGGDGMSLTKHIVIQMMQLGPLNYSHPLYFIFMLMLNYILCYFLAQKFCAKFLLLLIIQCLGWLVLLLWQAGVREDGKRGGRKKHMSGRPPRGSKVSVAFGDSEIPFFHPWLFEVNWMPLFPVVRAHIFTNLCPLAVYFK